MNGKISSGLPEEGSESRPDPFTREKKQKSTSKKTRDFNRKKVFNNKKTEKDLEDIAAKIKSQLWYGFDDVEDAAETVGVTSSTETQVIPNTTRGVGMLCQNLFNNLTTSLTNLPACTVYSLYRVSLLQLQLKLETVQTDCGVPQFPAEYRWHGGFDYNTQALVRANHINLGPISSLISAIGRVNVNGQSYLPIVEKSVVMETVTISELRAFVVLISNTATPPLIRDAAFTANALPGSHWYNAGDAWTLGNPDDIMPEPYGVAQMQADLESVRGLMNYAARKGFKGLTESCSIDYAGKGNPCILVSNLRGQCRLEPSLLYEQESPPLPSGTIVPSNLKPHLAFKEAF